MIIWAKEGVLSASGGGGGGGELNIKKKKGGGGSRHSILKHIKGGINKRKTYLVSHRVEP